VLVYVQYKINNFHNCGYLVNYCNNHNFEAVKKILGLLFIALVAGLVFSYSGCVSGKGHGKKKCNCPNGF
jgi:hypothetical protein